MKKRIESAFGKRVFLLGEDEQGKFKWLEEPTWDCDWYWGFGYIEEYTNHKYPQYSKDITMHTHWSHYISPNHPNEKESPLITTVLNEKESWDLSELMTTCYALLKTAEIFGRGGSHITTLPVEIDIVKDVNLAEKINKEILPKLFKEIEKILTP